ncbi:MAG: ArsR/SmtB family transcription factor [Candidatus Hydrogenedentota bacterium]
MQEILAITKALADSNRMRALMALRQGELCLCHLIHLLELAPSTVSKHMSILQQAGLVETRKEGRWIHYRLADAPAGSPIHGVLDWLREALANDAQIQEDGARRETVCCQSREELAECYRN